LRSKHAPSRQRHGCSPDLLAAPLSPSARSARTTHQQQRRRRLRRHQRQARRPRRSSRCPRPPPAPQHGRRRSRLSSRACHWASSLTPPPALQRPLQHQLSASAWLTAHPACHHPTPADLTPQQLNPLRAQCKRVSLIQQQPRRQPTRRSTQRPPALCLATAARPRGQEAVCCRAALLWMDRPPPCHSVRQPSRRQ
jgi:hypothetical protein